MCTWKDLDELSESEYSKVIIFILPLQSLLLGLRRGNYHAFVIVGTEGFGEGNVETLMRLDLRRRYFSLRSYLPPSEVTLEVRESILSQNMLVRRKIPSTIFAFYARPLCNYARLALLCSIYNNSNSLINSQRQIPPQLKKLTQ